MSSSTTTVPAPSFGMTRPAPAPIPRVSFTIREMNVFTIAMVIAYRIAQLQPGQALCFHFFSHSTTSGQVPASPYTMERTYAALRDFVDREKLSIDYRLGGSEIEVRCR